MAGQWDNNGGLTLPGTLNVTGVATFSNQTVTGSETITPGASTAAAGTTTADAGVLPAGTSSVYPTTAADGTKGVRIHASDNVVGREMFIGNQAAAILKVYPPSGGNINGLGVDAAFSSASQKGVFIVCLTAGASSTWLAA
jgi:hypothetical protein